MCPYKTELYKSIMSKDKNMNSNQTPAPYKIAVINSFPQYMEVKPEDIKFLSDKLSGEVTVFDITDLKPEDGDKKFDFVVSFNCVNAFHPEIAKLQVNAPITEKIVKSVVKGNRIVYKRDKHFNGSEVMAQAEFGKCMLTDKIKVLITVPVFERICKETLKSIYNLIVPDNVMAEFNFTPGYTVSQARNRQIAESLAGGYDYTLFVDSDIILPQNLLVNLLKANSDVATGWYIKKIPDGPKITEIYSRTRFDDFPVNVPQEELMQQAGGRVVPIGACGFGATLVKNSALVALKEFEGHWFEFIEERSPADGKLTFTCSEDLAFCRRLAEKGKTMVCDTSLRCFHIGQYLF